MRRARSAPLPLPPPVPPAATAPSLAASTGACPPLPADPGAAAAGRQRGVLAGEAPCTLREQTVAPAHCLLRRCCRQRSLPRWLQPPPFSLRQPQPCLPLLILQFLVPRQSYLHSLVPRALPLLHHLLPPGELVPWFEHGSLPLKWWVRVLGAGVAAWAGHGVRKGESWCARLPVGAPTARERWRLSVQPRCFARLQGRAGGSPVRFGGGARQGAALAPHPPLPRLPRQVRLMPLCLMIPSCT